MQQIAFVVLLLADSPASEFKCRRFGAIYMFRLRSWRVHTTCEDGT